MPEHHRERDGAIAGTGMGGAMDLAAGEAETLERPPGGRDRTEDTGKPRSLWSDAWPRSRGCSGASPR